MFELFSGQMASANRTGFEIQSFVEFIIYLLTSKTRCFLFSFKQNGMAAFRAVTLETDIAEHVTSTLWQPWDHHMGWTRCLPTARACHYLDLAALLGGDIPGFSHQVRCSHVSPSQICQAQRAGRVRRAGDRLHPWSCRVHLDVRSLC